VLLRPAVLFAPAAPRRPQPTPRANAESNYLSVIGKTTDGRVSHVLAAAGPLLIALTGQAQEPAPTANTTVSYGDKGLVIQSSDGNFKTQIRWRLQFRASTPFDADPETPEDFADPARTSLSIRRARLKLGGHAFRPWLEYYLEYDFPSSRLYDFRVTFSRYPGLVLRLGQWKAEFNRERRDSSGEQQFADRSLVNDSFTIDRQQGVQLSGRLLEGKLLDSSYNFGVFTGTGSNERNNDDAHPMWVVRYQWNLLGRELGFTQSDIEGRKKPHASLAGGFVSNRSPYTSFSGSGGGALPGFEVGAPGQFSVRQWLEDAAFHYRGFSFQHEFHWKRIHDNATGTLTNLRGSYAQAGFVVHKPNPEKPRGLEVAARWAFVDRDTRVPSNTEQELTGALNWFFRGHANKITLDASRLTLQQAARPRLSRGRVRLQWDVHF
jgi:phosphate-selective porin OprO and OprP